MTNLAMKCFSAASLAVLLSTGSAGAYAINGRTYASPVGTDVSNNCRTQTHPCKTITHATDMAGTNGAAPGWDVILLAPPGQTTAIFEEGVVVKTSGDQVSSNHPPLRIMPDPVSKPKVIIDGKGVRQVGIKITPTAHYVLFLGVYVTGNTGNCVDVQGTDATHLLKNFGLNLSGVYNCGGHAIHAKYTDFAYIRYGRIFNAKQDLVLIENSTKPSIYAENIYNLPEQGYPSVVGMKIVNSPDGDIGFNTGKLSGVKPTLLADHSPNMEIEGNSPSNLPNAFSCTIVPETDRVTDTISGNGTGCVQ